MRRDPTPRILIWWTPDDYVRIKHQGVGAYPRSDTFEEWLYLGQKAFDLARARGLNPVKVSLDADELIAFAERRGVDIDDAIARELAQVVYERTHQKNH